MWLMVVLALLGLDVETLSPPVRERLKPFLEVVISARAEHATLSTLASDTDRLLVLRRLDQGSVKIQHVLDPDGLGEADRAQFKRAIDEGEAEVNAANVKALLAMLPKRGWFSSKIYGQEAATGAFLVVQHADADLQRRFLPAIEAMVATGEARGSEYALMYDRIAVAEGRPQRYGTQMHCVAGKMVPELTEDPANLEARRAPMDFRWPDYAGYLANFGAC